MWRFEFDKRCVFFSKKLKKKKFALWQGDVEGDVEGEG